MAIECTYCEEKINAKRGIYIKCTVCQDINLCLECFSAGATLANHQSTHPYELVDCGSFSIIDETWKAYEELALLEAVELFGVGSWDAIAKAVETRSAEECKQRYLTVYVDNYFGRRTWNAVDKEQYTVVDHTCPDGRPLSPCLFLPEKHKIVDITREQQLRLGYMPKRDDFEREYDNEVEFLVSKLAVNANDDTELDEELKIAHINMYTDRLRERFRRKRVVLEYNLVKLFFHMHPEENCTTNNDSLQYNQNSSTDSTSQFSQTNDNSQTKYNNFGDKSKHPSNSSVKKTNNPNKNLSSNSILKYFSKISPTKAASADDNQPQSSRKESQEYSILSSYFIDLNKTIAEKDFNTMEKQLRTFCQFSSAEDHNQLIRNLAREKELKVKIKELIKRRKKGLRTLSVGTKIGEEPKTKLDQEPNSQTKKIPTKNALHVYEESIVKIEVDDKTSLSPTPQKKNVNKSDTSKTILSLPTYNPNDETGWRLLSDGEKRLCKKSNLKPSQYISFKAFLLKENDQKKKKGAGQRLFTGDIDKTVKKRIQDFLARNNWIKV